MIDSTPVTPDATASGAAAPPERRVHAATRSRRRELIMIGIVCLVLIVVLAAAALALQVYVYQRAGLGVRLAGADVSRDSRGQIQRAAAALVGKRGLYDAQLVTPQGAVAVRLDQLGVTIDAAATARRALQRGRVHVLGLALWYGRGGGVAPVVRFDPAAFQSGLAKLAPALEKPARDATLAIQGGAVVVKPAVDGLGIDQAALKAALLGALAAWRPFHGQTPLAPLQPAVSTAAAETAASGASAYLSAPLRLRYRGREIELSPATMAAMLSVNKGPDAETYPLTFDNPTGRAVLHRLFAFAETPAVSASVVLKGRKIIVKPSKEGFGLDMPRLLGDMDDAASRPGLREVVVPLTVLTPKMTTEQLQELGLAGMGSEFSTYYDRTNKSRSQNIMQAARIVDGAVIKPGAVFSLNDTLGPRTLNRGFDYAPVIQDGVLRLGVGGGICQFATTLFNAAFFAGLPIVERHPHDFFIDHYPIGRDAQVAYGSQDLKFRNDTRHSLLIRCWAIRGQLTIALIGSTGRTVTYTTSAFYDIRPSGTSSAQPRVITDSNLARGLTTFEKGYSGRSVKVVRTVKAGGKVLFSDTFQSTYAPKDWIKRVGTG